MRLKPGDVCIVVYPPEYPPHWSGKLVEIESEPYMYYGAMYYDIRYNKNGRSRGSIEESLLKKIGRL